MKKNNPFAIVLTDTHYTKDNIEQVNDIFDQCIELAKELKVNKVYHAGDIFTDRIAQNLSVLLAFKSVLKKFEDNDITFIAIPGNHDKTDLNSENSYLDVFNFGVVRKYQVEEQKKGLIICLLPYFKENGLYPELLKEVSSEIKDRAGKKILITHISVNGVKNNDGSVVDSGIGLKQFGIFDSVLVGHYHNRSKVGDNIQYIGSALPQRYGEDDEKGFTVINEDGTTLFVKSKFKKYSKVVIDLSSTNKKELNKLIDSYSESNDNVRFVLKGTDEQLATIDSKVFIEKGIDIKKESENILKSVEAADNGEFISFDKDSILKSFREFCKINSFKKEEIKQGVEFLNKI